MNISGKVPPKFVPGPLPRAALSPPDAQHSGLLECPLTTRVAKVVDQTYVFRLTGSCPSEPIFTYHECFYAAAKTLSDNASSAYDPQPRLVRGTVDSYNKCCCAAFSSTLPPAQHRTPYAESAFLRKTVAHCQMRQ